MIFFDIFFPGEFKGIYLFMFFYNGIRYIFANYMKAFAILTSTKSCCQPSLLFKDTKDISAHLSFLKKGEMFIKFYLLCKV